MTSYSYDALGNLTQAVQNGTHTRTFTYDSLSHLLTSINPETNPTIPITYAYDEDGNVATKTDSRAIKTTYGYDQIHRESARSYSNGDPSLAFTYDQTNCLGLANCANIGHRTGMTDAAGSEAWSFDVVDRIRLDQRTTTSSPSNVTNTTTYHLDYAGNTTSITYPTGRVVNYTYDAANRPSTASDGSSGISRLTPPTRKLFPPAVSPMPSATRRREAFTAFQSGNLHPSPALTSPRPTTIVCSHRKSRPCPQAAAPWISPTAL